MPVAQYSLGPPAHPEIQWDKGFLGAEAAHSLNVKSYATLGAGGVLSALYCGATQIKNGCGTYGHFLEGRSTDRYFNYNDYVTRDTSGAITQENAIVDFEESAEQLVAENFSSQQKEFEFSMTGTAIKCGASKKAFPEGARRFLYPVTEDWQNAIGYHVIWLSGNVTVLPSLDPQKPPARFYNAEMTLHAEDRYNFNPGMADIKTGIRDQLNGELELSGLGKDFMQYSSLVKKFGWAEPRPRSGKYQEQQYQPQGRR